MDAEVEGEEEEEDGICVVVVVVERGEGGTERAAAELDWLVVVPAPPSGNTPKLALDFIAEEIARAMCCVMNPVSVSRTCSVCGWLRTRAIRLKRIQATLSIPEWAICKICHGVYEIAPTDHIACR